MDLRATKDRYERESDEAERLVRPAPKLKPPRHDRQRKHVEPQEQDDIDEAKAEDDPDLSVNYKGRSATNIVIRYLAAKAKQKRVPALNVETKEVVPVSPETIKAQPGKYKLLKDKDEKGEAPEAKPDDKPSSEERFDKPEAKPAKDEKFFAEAGRDLREMAKANPALGGLLQSLKPGSETFFFAQKKPDFPLAQVPQAKGVKFPPGVETLGDLVEAYKAKPAAAAKQPKPGKEKKPAETAPSGSDTKAIADKLDALVKSDDLSPEDIAGLREELAKAKADPSLAPNLEKIQDVLGMPDVTVESLSKALEERPDSGKKPETAPPDDDAAMTERLFERAKKDPKIRAEMMKRWEEMTGKPAEPWTDTSKPKPGEEVELPESDLEDDPDEPAPPAKGKKPKAEKPKEDKPKEDKPAKASPAEAEMKAWEEAGGLKDEKFWSFAEKDPTVIEIGGGPRFIDPKTNKHVPFTKLPPEQQLQWVKRYETGSKTEKAVKDLQPLVKDNPQIKQVLKDLSDPKSELAQSLAKAGKPEHLNPLKVIPALKGIKLPGGIDTVSDLMSAAKEVNKPLPTPQRREVSSEEQGAANYELKQTFPKSVAQALIEARTHPDDIRDIVDSYHKAREQAPREDLGSFLARVTPFYQTDPNKIEPPKTGMNEAGKEVPWEKLNPEEQAESMAQHRNKVVALSMAARAHTATEFMNKTKAPAALAAKLADFTLNRPEGETPDQRHKRAEMMAQDMFQKAMTSGDEPEEMSDRDIKRAMDLIAKDPAAQTVAVGFLQAHDYQLARQKFLGSSDDAISEHDSPSKISRGIQKAVSFLRNRTKLYPEGAASQDTPGMFRTRILDRLRTLVPDTHREVREQVNEAAVSEYESELKDWNRATLKYDAKYQKLKDKCEAMGGDACDPEKPAKKPKVPSGSPYRDAPPQAKAPAAKPNKKLERLQEELATLTARAPKAPVPPPGYKPPSGTKHGEKGTIWDEVKLASRVACRYVFSTCTHGNAMDRTASQDRQGVYWGVAPDATKPYSEWEQAHQRDLGKRDYDGLLTAARDWLKTPVLAKSVDGIVRDTQVRAALDLAIRTHEEGRYSVGVHPTVYNYLLAKLAGESPTETLLTVRASDGSVYAATGERTAMKPSAHIRAYAAKIASTHPEIAFDLANLSSKVAQDEKEEKKDDKKEEGKAFPGAAKPFEKKEAQADADKKQSQDEPKKDEPKDQGQKQAQDADKKQSQDEPKKDEPKDQGQKQAQDADKKQSQDEPKDAPKEQQAKEAYLALRSACIRTASTSPQARLALTPVLQLIKQIG